MEKRNVQLKFRVTPSEHAIIKDKMEQAGILRKGAYLRKMALDGYVLRMDLSDVKEVIRLMRISSNNLNQYAKKANETGNIYLEDIRDLQQKQEELWERLNDILDRLSMIR
ncbi:MAG: plasmid mobilization relaxosome protein MobC [Bacteroidaceae bacterium]|nr:plasmid mobilization relaxosome protein MobC [Bacteroidaceae bacterium]